MTSFMETMRQLFSYFTKGHYLPFLGEGRTNGSILQAGSPRADGELIGSIDIGTTSIHALIGQIKPHGVIKILGVGESKARGWRMGEVVNEEDAVESLQAAVNLAELSAGRRMPPVILGISGELAARQWLAEKHFKARDGKSPAPDLFGQRSTELIHCHRRNGGSLPAPMIFMVGSPQKSLALCLASLSKIGVTVKEVYWAPLSLGLGNSYAYNSEIETMLIDIGGTHTSVALYRKGALIDAFAISTGGDDITNDIAIGFGITVKEAEQLKRRFGVASEKASLGYTQIQLSWPLASRYNLEVIYHIEVARIIEKRLRQMFTLIERRLDETTPGDVAPDQILLTGGGVAVEGMDTLASKVFGIESRFYAPCLEAGVDDVVSALRLTNAYGLLQLNRIKLVDGYRPAAVISRSPRKRFRGFRFAFNSKTCDNPSPNKRDLFPN